MESMTSKQAMATPCAVDQTLAVLSGKWTIRIIYRLIETDTPMRFSAIKRAVPGITEKMITAQLRELEAKGIVKRQVFPVVPPHVEYSLTDLGTTLEPILSAMKVWGESHQSHKRFHPSTTDVTI